MEAIQAGVLIALLVVVFVGLSIKYDDYKINKNKIKFKEGKTSGKD